jgi:hypothetical protein
MISFCWNPLLFTALVIVGLDRASNGALGRTLNPTIISSRSACIIKPKHGDRCAGKYIEGL